MLTQRWRARRDSYRPAGEPIRTDRHEVAAIADDTTAKAFVEEHHYSGTYPAARFRFGLYERDVLVGVAVFSHPARDDVLTRVFPGTATESVELGRFVLLDRVPANGETWFLARCFAALRREGLVGVLSFSDPHPRRALDGRLVFPGHIGTIYQAFNGVYRGAGGRRTLHLLPDGRVLSARTLSKIRAGERGWRHAAAQLERHGAPPAPEDPEERRGWLATWRPRLTRTTRHPGNHCYAWPLAKSLRLPPGLPYPKLRVA